MHLSYHQHRLGGIPRVSETEDHQRSQKAKEGERGNVSNI